MSRKWFRFAIASLLLGSAVAACGGGGGSGAPVLEVGVITPLTGGAADYGTQFWKGVQLAVEEVNASGGVVVDGQAHQIEAEVCDDEFVPAKSARCGQMLSDSLMVFTPATQSAFPLMGFNEKDGFILMATSMTPALTRQGNELVVRLTTDSQLQITEFVDLLHGYGTQTGTPLDKVAIMQVNSEFGASWAESFAGAWTASGGVVTGTAQYKTEATDFTSELTSLLQAKPDAIALTTVCAPSALVVQQARNLGFTGTFVSAVCPGGTGLTDHLDPASLGRFVAATKQNAYTDVPVVAEFITKYEERFGEEVTEDTPAFGYFGIAWFAKAVAKAGTTEDPAKIHDAFEPALAEFGDPNLLGIRSYEPQTGNVDMATYLGVTTEDGSLTKAAVQG